MQVCKVSSVFSILVHESILVYNSKTCELISFKSCILIRNKPIDMCAKFGKDQSIRFYTVPARKICQDLSGFWPPMSGEKEIPKNVRICQDFEIFVRILSGFHWKLNQLLVYNFPALWALANAINLLQFYLFIWFWSMLQFWFISDLGSF